MAEWFVSFLSGYSWTFIVWLVCVWVILRSSIFMFNRRGRKSRTAKAYYRFARRAITGRNYKSAVMRLNLYSGVVLLMLAVLVPVGLFIEKARWWWISPNPMEWGVIGDFFGGMLNPILAFASFMALLYTIRIQSEELKLTREEFKKSVEAQKRIANEAETRLGKQILLEDYRHIAEKLRRETSELSELVKNPISKQGFPIGSTPPSSIGELLHTLSLNFYDNAKEQTDDADSCFERARQAYLVKSNNKVNKLAQDYFNDELDDYLKPFLKAAIIMAATIEMHAEVCKAVKVIDVQNKIREADARSAITIVAYAYIIARTFTRLSSHCNYNNLVPKNPERLTVLKEILGNLSLPTKALDSV